MHICFITNEYPKPGYPHGGIGSFVASLSKSLIAAGQQVSVVGINYTNSYEVERDGNFAVHRLPKHKMKGLSWLLHSRSVNAEIAKIHRQTPIDVVEASELGLAFIRKIPKIRYVIRMHGGHHFFSKSENRNTEWRKVWQERKSFANADHIIAVSKYVADTTRDLLKLGDREITIIYNPIDTDKFYLSDPEKLVPNRIFFAGTLIEKKGIRQLVQSLEYLVDEFPDLQLIIAGKDANVPGTRQAYRPILESAIRDKIRNHVVFLGRIPNSEIPHEIEKAQICCFPSHMEAMPIAWLEVLAMGKVLLGSMTGPGPEVIREHQTGFLTDPHNPKAIADKIREIFNNYDLALQYAANARERILAEFDVRHLAQQNIQFYSSIIANN